MSFQEDLNIGESIELKVLMEINQKYPNAYKVQGYFKDYDIYIPEIDKSVEVKLDLMSLETGNIVVEISYGGIPSALLTTKADFWVFVTPNKCIWTTPKRIKKSIGMYKKDPARFKGRGDDKYKLAWLIPIKFIEETSLIIKPFSP